MKISICDGKRYIALFIAISLLFCFILFSLFRLGEIFCLNVNTPIVTDADKNSPIVVIDAGHGGEDGGTVGKNGVFEKDLNLDISLKLYELLRSRGIEAVLTRNEDILLYDKNSDYKGHKKEQDLLTRRKICEGYENAIFVSIHMNSFPEEKYSGLQVWYSSNDDTSKQLADAIQAISKERLMPENRRVPKAAGSNIYLLSRLTCPSVLVECGFLSNVSECERLCDDAYQGELALCLCDAIIEYINLSKNNSLS